DRELFCLAGPGPHPIRPASEPGLRWGLCRGDWCLLHDVAKDAWKPEVMILSPTAESHPHAAVRPAHAHADLRTSHGRLQNQRDVSVLPLAYVAWKPSGCQLPR